MDKSKGQDVNPPTTEKSAGTTSENGPTTTGNQESIETTDNTLGFDSLRKDFEKNEAIKELLKTVGSYIDFKLEGDFSSKEKSNIKLIFLGEIEQKLQLKNITDTVISGLLQPLNSIIQKWNTEGTLGEKVTKSSEELSKISDKFSKVFSSFGLEGTLDEINTKIVSINKEKKDNKTNFSSVKDVFYFVNPDETKGKTDEQIYNDIKTQTLELGKKLISGKEFGSYVKEGISKLPFDLGDKAKDLLKDLVKSFPILGILFGIIFGEDFLSEDSDKQKKSLENLQTFSENNDFPFTDSIKKEDIEKIDQKKLEKFYKFLDTKDQKIDYTKEGFWEGILTGNTNDEKIKKLHELLKNAEGEIDLGDSNQLDNLITKLDGLGKKQRQKKKAEDAQKLADGKAKEDEMKTDVVAKQATIDTKKQEILTLEAKADKTVTETQQLETIKKETAAAEKELKTKEQELQKQETANKALKEEQEFIDSVSNIQNLPTEILYKGKKIELNIENNNIVLGDKKFKINITALGIEQFKSVEFKNGNIVLNGENNIDKEKMLNLIKELLEKEKYNFSGKKGYISYKGKITSIA